VGGLTGGAGVRYGDVPERSVPVLGPIMDVGGVGGWVVGACPIEDEVELTLPRIVPPEVRT